MKPPHRPPKGHDDQAVPAQRLERLAAPLTVLHANIQLLQRRIRGGQAPDPEGLLRVLDKLEQASRTLADELRELNDAVTTERRDRAKMARNQSSAVFKEGERDA